jgi:outer membrane protein assembly factor BamB/SAM-dependent methyltransferase
MKRWLAGAVLAAGAAAGEDAAPGPSAEAVRRVAGVEAGLAVHVGATDGRFEADMAAGGRFLVHGLALDGASLQAARAAIRAAGLEGLASVVPASALDPLPYPDDAVNLLVADLGGLGAKAPPEAELLRVVAPGGVACLDRGSGWVAVPKPRPGETDDWGHFDHGPDGNGVSRDRRVRAPVQLQWMSGVQAIPLGGNPAGYDPGAGVRISAGTALIDYKVAEGTDRRRRQGMLAGFDAWSGVPLWKAPRDVAAAGRRWQFVADGGCLYTFLKGDGPLAAVDARTGMTLRTYDVAAGKPLRDEGTQVRVAGDLLVVNMDTGLFALDAGTGALRWLRPAGGAALLFPVVDPAAKRVYVLEADASSLLRSRWPWAIARTVIGLDAQTGKEVFRCDAVAGKPVGQILPAGDHLVLFCGSAIGGRGDKEGGGWLGSIRLRDGALAGEATFKVAWNDSMYNAVVRDGTVYYAGHTTIYQAPVDTVQVSRGASLGYNQRCNRFVGLLDGFIWGYVTYLDRQFNGTLQSVCRAGCAIGAAPANGRVYFTPSACNCFSQLRGYTCLTPEPLRPLWPEARRLEAGDGRPAPAGAPAAAAPPAGPLVDEWARQGERAAADETEPVEAGDGLRIVSVVHRHRVEARVADGTVRWAFAAGGRVSGRPVVVDGRVLFGSHDGWVYALRAADGALAWRHLVAPRERWMVAYGQLESTWPVYGVALLDGTVVASAGRHPETGGGVFVAALDPKTGAAAWRRTLCKPPAAIATSNGRSTGAIVPRSFLNEAPVVEGGRIRIGEFTFDPGETDADLSARLATPPPRKK